ncbi:hypothetical protein CALCODRAFT_327879 [Calocera cornea HHB12733]|uniref:Uncharacterized protein n=1 Tax=Calocera cornea HHB12733 TaxID=1353952 RepID=A0A165JHE5_9BASI|nr:hypothetical protein CALCODRAFT_327879 [Calocera cornea HHB12733]
MEALCTNAISAVTGSNSGGFQTQGQIDITSIIISVLQLGLAILERSSQVGIERLTLEAGHSIGARLPLGYRAAQRVEQEISQSHAFSWTWTVLHTCIGTKHVVRRLAESREGQSMLSLIGCLSELYSVEICADILEGLFDMLRQPSELMPSKDQWIRLVRVCHQAVPTTAFKDMLARMPNSQFQPRHHSISTTVHIKAIAEALCYFLKPGTEPLRIVYLAGGADCGRIAAIVYWLMDYSVDIRDGPDKPLLSLTGATQDPTWVIAMYDEEPIFAPVYFKDKSGISAEGYGDEFNA